MQTIIFKYRIHKYDEMIHIALDDHLCSLNDCAINLDKDCQKIECLFDYNDYWGDGIYTFNITYNHTDKIDQIKQISSYGNDWTSYSCVRAFKLGGSNTKNKYHYTINIPRD